jgi:glutathione S-transferase
VTITLYHCVSARSFRVLWMLEELSRPYRLVMLPFPPRVHARSYLEINPLGTVPLMIHGETRMTESAAICQYLCAISAPTSLQVEPTESDFGAWLNYLHFGEATLTFPQTLVLRYSRFEPEERRQPTVAEDYTKWFLARARTLEPILAAREYLCAGRFTAADVSVGYALQLAEHLGLTPRFTPAVAAYWGRLQKRDSYVRALRAQEVAAVEQGISTVPSPDAGVPTANAPHSRGTL